MELKPCPFCGEMPEVENISGVLISCSCKLEPGVYGDINTAIADWNTRAAPRWIPVTERLPEYLKVVNVSDGTYVGSGYVNNVGNWITDGKTNMKSVTHWMPLPEPPKEVEG